jgi:uracil phosphoribosyltransferase
MGDRADDQQFGGVLIVDHPVVADRVRTLRDRHTPTSTFRRIVGELAGMVAYEATRDLRTVPVPVDTPVRSGARAERLADSVLVVPILRAGLGMSEAICALLPGSEVAHVGLRRDEVTLTSVVYLNLLPADLAGRDVVICDPMLATGGSLSRVCAMVLERGATRVRAVCLLAAREGIERMVVEHPEVRVVCAAVDEELDERGYITPGLGDAGDRLFGALE